MHSFVSLYSFNKELITNPLFNDCSELQCYGAEYNTKCFNIFF